MTCREKLAIEHPEHCSDEHVAGCFGCPDDYGYLPTPDWCSDQLYGAGLVDRCTQCWNREIPEEKATESETRRMTYLEKFKQEHPEMSDFELGYAICDQCCQPNMPGCPDGFDMDCRECWNREISEAKETEGALKRTGEAAKKIVNDLQQAVEATANMTSSIKDSGDRTEFETGAVRDMREGKGRCDLMPLRVAALVMQGDGVIDCVGKFQETDDTEFLYSALKSFAHQFYGLANMLLEVAKHFEEGAKKYGENNWQKGIPVHCYIDSAIRHYLKWLRGDKDEPHDRAFVWNIMCCIWEVDYHKNREE